MPRRFYGYLAAALLVAVAAAWPLWAGPGLLNTRGGGDSPFLVQRVQQLATAWEAGSFPVRWMPDANYGYGYPFFHYYAPLALYVAAGLHRLGWEIVPAIQLTQTLGFLIASAGMFGLVWRWQRHELAAWLASVGYTTAPFHLVNVYVRGDSLGEFWAMAFYPVVGWALDRVVDNPTWRRAMLLGLAYAALILCHNISALIFSPFVVGYAVLGVWGRPHPRRALGLVAVGLAAGLAAAAWFWWPALAEQELAQLGPVTQGYFHYSQHFRGRDLIQTSWMFDYDVVGGQAFRMGLFQTVMTGVGLVGWLVWMQRGAAAERPARRRVALMVGGTLIVATLMITPWSRGVWEHVPLLPFTQFPWRFLSIQALGTAVAWGGLVCLLVSPAGAARPWLAGLAAGGVGAAALATALVGLRPDYLPLSAADMTPERLAAYEWFTGNIGSTISAEYLPPTVQPRPYTSLWLEQGVRDRGIVLAGRATTQLIERTATQQTWVITAQEDATVVLPLLYWPGWQAERHSTAWPLTPAAGSGLSQLDVPAGQHKITLRLTRTPVRLAAESVSLLTLVLMTAAMRPTWRALGWGVGLMVLGGGVAAGGARLWPAAPTASGPLTWDFAQAAYLHPAAERGVLFSNQARLLTYTYSAKETPAGRSWQATLVWEGDGGEATLALTTPAIHRATAGQPVEPFINQTQAVTDGPVIYTFDLPANLPTGLLLPRLTVADAHPLAANGTARGDLFLEPLRVTPAEPPPTRPMPPASLWVTVDGLQERPDGRLALQLAWFTATAQSHNYKAVVRLLDSRGLLYAQYDAQPGGNYRPVSDWPAGEWVHDWLTLTWLADDGLAPYTLAVSLYDAASGEVVFTRRLGELAGEAGRRTWTPAMPQFTLPAERTPLAAVWGEDAIALRGFQTTQTAEVLQLSLMWQALSSPLPDYTHFVHLLPAGALTDPPLRQHDAVPVWNTYPTSQWTAGEVVLDPVILDLQGAPPGFYRLAVGLYQAQPPDYPRLTLTETGGEQRLGDALLLPYIVQVAP